MRKQKSLEYAVKTILKSTLAQTGPEFFPILVKNLADVLQVPAAWVSEYNPGFSTLTSIAFMLDGELLTDIIYPVAGTPCEVVMKSGEMAYYADQVAGHFPDDPDLTRLGMCSYAGVPFKGTGGNILGHVAVMDRHPVLDLEFLLAVIEMFAVRAGAELMRTRAEQKMLQQKTQLALLLDSAPDAIIELDEELHITMLNREASHQLQFDKKNHNGLNLRDIVNSQEFTEFSSFIKHLSDSDKTEGKQWFPRPLNICRSDDTTFPAEITLSYSKIGDSLRYTLILRNIEERVFAQAEIRTLRQQKKHLKEELEEALGPGEILGNSGPLMQVLSDVKQVAATNASVLILGETGTGKELFARLLHKASTREKKPLVKVNCAAIPEGLIESELFGHSKGAFTGATQKQQGRFGLANGGTIFLDEIAELPLELQPKLLRVLQEGEFEPVGSGITTKVDVRIIAATNRNLQKMVSEHSFREDLYYRLNVFPLELPPLRERGDDVVILAETFARDYSCNLGKSLDPLSKEQKEQLKRYNWPGNIRELQNVIERACITTTNSSLNLKRALPEIDSSITECLTCNEKNEISEVLTIGQLREIEKQNIQRALERTAGRISGKNGAAYLLGLPTSTLNSRIKALGIK